MTIEQFSLKGINPKDKDNEKIDTAIFQQWILDRSVLTHSTDLRKLNYEPANRESSEQLNLCCKPLKDSLSEALASFGGKK